MRQLVSTIGGRRLLLLGLLLTLAAFLAACGSGADGGADSGGSDADGAAIVALTPEEAGITVADSSACLGCHGSAEVIDSMVPAPAANAEEGGG